MNRNLQRIKTVVRDCEPAIALTNRALLPRIQATAGQDPELMSLGWMATEEIEPMLAETWRPPSIDERNVAFLQYTSGSTAEPKGVIVRHANLIANSKMIQQAFKVTSDSTIVGWLPLYHDMGLIGNVLQTLWAGARCVLFTPGMLLRRPLDWLHAITRYRATISGGPNFAYDLCARKATPQECEGLDLSSWRVAFNGSEPIHSETMMEFTDRFASYGFDRRSFLPCYGLAEATLFVSGHATNGNHGIEVDSESLSLGKIVRSDDSLHTQTLVGSGSPAAGLEVAIVNPETRDICDRGGVGEV
jgi:acyl-CoA synthetase (AMP-forming)/AMP-acid ligase II